MFAVFICEEIFGTLPREMMESVYSDGASPFTTFLRLGLPLSVSVLVSGTVFQFMRVRNDQLAARIIQVGNLDVAPMSGTISSLVNSYGNWWQLLTTTDLGNPIPGLMDSSCYPDSYFSAQLPANLVQAT